MDIENYIKNNFKKSVKKAIDFCCFLLLIPSYLSGKEAIEKNMINKILLINLQGIGDIIMTTPFLTALRKEFPKAEINYLCYKGNGDLLEGDTRINSVIKRNKDDILSLDFLETLKEVRRKKYDLCINLFPAQHSALLLALSNARYKLGNLYCTKSTSNHLNVKKATKTWDIRQNAKNIAEQIELNEYDLTKLSVTISEETKRKVKEIFAKEGIKKQCIGINPHATWISKNWPDTYWKKLFEEVIKKYKNNKIVIFGGSGDKEHTSVLLEQIKKDKAYNETRIINLIGKLTLKQTAGALKEMDLFITTDSGLLHIALAAGTKTIGLFGVSDPSILVKGNQHVTVVSSYDQCPKKFQFNHNNEPPDWEQECMKKICVDIVLEKIQMIMKFEKQKHNFLK